MKLRVGIIGTGVWARKVHIPALIAHPDVELIGIWGRDRANAALLAAKHDLRAFDDFDDLLRNVDVVDLVVAPVAQPHYAVRAAQAGRHLLLEKPVGMTSNGVALLSRLVEEQQLSAVIFLARLFDPGRAHWLQTQSVEKWTHGRAEWVSGNFLPGSPYAGQWRDEAGPLFDVGPHLISQLEFVLGRISSVAVTQWSDKGELELIFEHDSGAESSAMINMYADVPATQEKVSFSRLGHSAVNPDQPMDYLAAFSAAVDELVRQIDFAPPVNATIRCLSGIDEGIHAIRIIEQAQQIVTNGN